MDCLPQLGRFTLRRNNGSHHGNVCGDVSVQAQKGSVRRRTEYVVDVMLGRAAEREQARLPKTGESASPFTIFRCRGPTARLFAPLKHKHFARTLPHAAQRAIPWPPYTPSGSANPLRSRT